MKRVEIIKDGDRWYVITSAGVHFVSNDWQELPWEVEKLLLHYFKEELPPDNESP